MSTLFFWWGFIVKFSCARVGGFEVKGLLDYYGILREIV
jgi:hypothetical protein